MIILKQLLFILLKFLKLYKVRANHLMLSLVLVVAGYMVLKLASEARPRAGAAPAPAPAAGLDEEQLQRLAGKLERLNHDPEIFNWKPFGDFTPDTDVIAIQVHENVEGLRNLIASLANVRHVQKVLLIFSHSRYDDIINRLVRNVTFARVMQIFYPHSLQLNPGRYPSVEPGDEGRDAVAVQHKQHWWWKANYIFACEWAGEHTGIVIFLEEDDAVLPDLLHVLAYARVVLAQFPAAEVISLGRPPAARLDYDLFTVEAWRPARARGLAFNRTTWRKIAARAEHFCFYDDTSWSYSLMHVFGKFPAGLAEAVGAEGPRVGGWRAPAGGARLFPAPMRAVVAVGRRGRTRRLWPPPRGNGGWADARDRLLCLDPLLATSTDNAPYTTFLIDDDRSPQTSKKLLHQNYPCPFYFLYYDRNLKKLR